MGEPTLAAFRDRYWDDNAVLAARDRIRIIPDGDGEKHQVTVIVFTNDGRVLTASAGIVHGSAGDPMTEEEEVSAKYFDACAHGGVPHHVGEQLRGAVLSLDEGGSGFWAAWQAVGA